MFDHRIRPLIDPPLNRLGKRLNEIGVSANQATIFGFFAGLVAMFLILKQNYLLAAFFLGINRLADGIDGAIARHSGLSDFGGFLDIVCDFLIYSGIVFAFGMVDPSKLPYSSFLVFSFIGPMVSFLAYAIVASKRKVHTEIRGKKSFYYLGGICEGAETTFFLLLFCFFPNSFNFFATVFAGLCWLTTIGRVAIAWNHFK